MQRLLAQDARTIALDEEIPAGEEITAGTPTAAYATLADEGGLEIGVWEMTAGSARDTESDELFVVVAGRATVAFQDGTTIDLAPGTVVHLEAGERTAWTVHETLRKVYVARG